MPRPYDDTVQGTAPGEVVHLDFLYVGSSGPEGSEGLPEEDGFRYILVIMDDLSTFFPWSHPRLAQPRLRLSTCSIGARLWGCRVCGLVIPPRTLRIAEIKYVFQHSYAQGKYRMNALMHVAEDDQGDVFVLVDWEGFDAEERTWESRHKIHYSAPDFLLKELLRKLRLTRALKGKLASGYGISL